MKRFRFRYKETIVTIIAEEDKFFKIAVESILEARRKIEAKIREDPLFYTTLEPYDCTGEIVERMCKASKLANVGPMATVAGVIAQYGVEKMVSSGAEFAVIDNGGDIAMYLNKPIKVGLFTYTNRLCFLIEEKGFYSVCTSSGTIGHSISFGFVDSATIFAKDACVADAFATALGNEIKENFGRGEIENVLRDFWKKARDHIDGALVVKGEIIGFVGKIPKMIKANVNPDLITRG